MPVIPFLPRRAKANPMPAPKPKPLSELQAIVASEDELRQKRKDLLAEIEQADRDHAEKQRQRREEADQLRRDLMRCGESRRQLESRTKPSKKELDLTEKVKASLEDEMHLRNQAGMYPLASHYIVKDPSETKEGKELSRLNAQIKKLEGIRKHGDSRSSEHARAGRKLSHLSEQRDELAAKMQKDARLYSLGRQICELRDRRQEMSNERERLQSERQEGIATATS